MRVDLHARVEKILIFRMHVTRSFGFCYVSVRFIAYLLYLMKLRSFTDTTFFCWICDLRKCKKINLTIL